MQTEFIDSCAPRRCRNWLTTTILATLAAACLLPLAATQAVEVESLYDARVPLDPSAPDGREAAYERALQQVLVRVTGSEDAAFSPELKTLFPDPARYVLQFRPGEDDTLWVSFDGAAIEQMLAAQRQPVWGRDRPLTMLWLAVDWGQGQREVVAARAGDADPRNMLPDRQQRLRDRVQEVARLRGLPIKFPPAGLVASDTVSASDVWGGFHQRLLNLSRQNGAGSVLVGRLRPNSAGSSRFSWYFGNEERSWQVDLEDAVHLLADSLAAEFAFAGDAPREAVALTISNLTSVADYAAVEGLLDGLQVVDEYAIDLVSGDRIRYRVRLNGGADRLASLLDFNAQLEREAAPQDPLGNPAAGRADVLSYRFSR